MSNDTKHLPRHPCWSNIPPMALAYVDDIGPTAGQRVLSHHKPAENHWNPKQLAKKMLKCSAQLQNWYNFHPFTIVPLHEHLIHLSLKHWFVSEKRSVTILYTMLTEIICQDREQLQRCLEDKKGVLVGRSIFYVLSIALCFSHFFFGNLWDVVEHIQFKHSQLMDKICEIIRSRQGL